MRISMENWFPENTLLFLQSMKEEGHYLLLKFIGQTNNFQKEESLPNGLNLKKKVMKFSVKAPLVSLSIMAGESLTN